MFYQDGQWWTIEYEDNFYDEQGIDVYAFKNNFVKRFVLGATIIEY